MPGVMSASVGATNYGEFLARVIDDGKRAATHDYPPDSPKLLGSIAGFDACAHKAPEALTLALLAAKQETARRLALALPDPDAYWFARCFELEVDWVCNVVSAVLANEGLKPIRVPTSLGVLAMARILGVALSTPQWWADSPDAGDPACLCSFCLQPIPDDPDGGAVRRTFHARVALELRCCVESACMARYLDVIAEWSMRATTRETVSLNPAGAFPGAA